MLTLWAQSQSGKAGSLDVPSLQPALEQQCLWPGARGAVTTWGGVSQALP